jgi:hypothetical protein
MADLQRFTTSPPLVASRRRLDFQTVPLLQLRSW